MKYSDKLFDIIVNLLFELSEKGFVTSGHRLYGECYFEYKIDNICNGIITGSTSLSEVDKLINKLEQLNK